MSKEDLHIDLYELVTKQLDGTISEQESSYLYELLTSPENKREYDALNAIWNTPLKPAITFDSHSAFAKVQSRIHETDSSPRQSKIIPLWRNVISIAASVIVLFGAYWYFSTTKNNTSDSINNQTPVIATHEETASDTVKDLQLVDGSNINIAANSSISYNDAFGDSLRKVSLKGQAYFAIAKDSTKPFVIDAQSVEVTVLGTEFYVNTSSSFVDIIVETGKVRVKDYNSNEEIILTAGQSSHFDNTSQSFNQTDVDENDLFWHTRQLKFVRQEISLVAETIEEWYKVSFDLDDAILNCRLTASFNNNSIDEIVEVIANTLDLEYSKKGNKIKLYGKACDE